MDKISQQKIKSIRSLHLKKNRDNDQCFYLEGETLINELLSEFPELIQQLVVSADKYDAYAGYEYPICVGTHDDLERISQQKSPKKVNAIVNYPPLRPYTGKGRALVLDGLQDPGNLGTLIRCADWFGIESVICSENSVDFFNPKVVHASMASVFRVALWRTDLHALVASYPTGVYGAFMEGTDYQTIEPSAIQLLVLGNEGKGISHQLEAELTQRIRIPKYGKAESLNVGIAGGILMNHMALSPNH
ncbi:MAG: hypothetical protein RLZZ301_1145 [Bacteroidota bacterium]